MTESYEQAKRVRRIAGIKEQAFLKQGIVLRSTGPGVAAMVGYREDGSVFVWDEITNSIHQVAPAGSVDVASLPVEKQRGRPKAEGTLKIEIVPLPKRSGF